MKKYFYAFLVLGLASCAHKETQYGTNEYNAVSENQDSGTQEHDNFRFPANAQGIELYTMSADGRTTVNFERCKGVAKLGRNNGKLTLQIRESNCANVITDLGEWKLNGDGADNRWIDVVFNEDTERTAKVTVASNRYVSSNGKEGNADVFFIKIKPKSAMTTFNLNWRADTKEVRLEKCGGTVEAKISSGQLSVIFRDLRYCNLFDIVSNEGFSVGYDAKEIQRNSDGFSGSFSIPKKFVDVGSNAVIVQVYSKYGASEKIKLLFQGK